MEVLKHKSYRAEALKAAQELCYSEVTLERIRYAKNDEAIRLIMVNARKEFYND